jgi:GntR family transcriptional regulator
MYWYTKTGGPTMWFQVDPRSPTPVYQQVVDGVKAAVARGLARPGDRLPSVRELATLMTLNHNTVAKAYQELERQHVIEVIRGRGTFIAPESPPSDREGSLRQLTHGMTQMLVEAHYLKLDGDDLLALFREVIRQWEAERGTDE